MTALIDSGFLYATVDKSDANHQRVIGVLNTLTDDVVLPTVVLVEVAYLLQARLGYLAMRRFIQQLEYSPLEFVPLARVDVPRIHALLDQYADAQLDFVDAAIIAIAERLDICCLLTVDQRDFRIVRPAHCAYLEILP